MVERWRGCRIVREGSTGGDTMPAPDDGESRGTLARVPPVRFIGVNRGILTPILTPNDGTGDSDSENPQGSTPVRTCTLSF